MRGGINSSRRQAVNTPCDRGREYISGAFLDLPKPGLLKDRNKVVRLRQGVPQSVTPVSPRVSGSA